jgi:hypothetical protein
VIPIWLRTETRYQPIRIIEIFIVNLVSAFEERLRSEKIRSEEMRKQLFVGKVLGWKRVVGKDGGFACVLNDISKILGRGSSL